MNNEQIPFLDLVTHHIELEEELVGVFREALRTGRFIGGPSVTGFEEAFAEFCSARRCIGVGSGTDALRFALIAAGVRPGESVVTVPNTFIATTEAITQAGAFPEFIDIDEKTYNMDVERLKEFLEEQCTPDDKTGRPVSKRTARRVSAVVPVHLYGQMADMDPIMELTERYNLIVIEDACQAHGAEYFSKRHNAWLKAGSIGKAAAFSFYPGKNLGALGEAGAVTTNDDEITRQISMLRDHGQSQKYFHEVEGYNGRLDAIQAGMLRIKLKGLKERNTARHRNAFYYNELLLGADRIIPPFEPDWSRAVYHLYVVRVKDREELQRSLSERGCATGLHYPLPLHRQKAYAHLGFMAGAFPVSEKAAEEILSLPMFPELTESQQVRVVECLKEFVCRPA